MQERPVALFREEPGDVRCNDRSHVGNSLQRFDRRCRERIEVSKMARELTRSRFANVGDADRVQNSRQGRLPTPVDRSQEVFGRLLAHPL